MQKEDMLEDMEKFSNFLHIANDFVEHWRRACGDSIGVQSLDFVFHIASPIPFPGAPSDGTIVNITHTSDHGLQVMVKQARLPLLLLSAKDKEELLKCEGISEELKARIQEVKVHE